MSFDKLVPVFGFGDASSLPGEAASDCSNSLGCGAVLLPDERVSDSGEDNMDWSETLALSLTGNSLSRTSSAIETVLEVSEAVSGVLSFASSVGTVLMLCNRPDKFNSILFF